MWRVPAYILLLWQISRFSRIQYPRTIQYKLSLELEKSYAEIMIDIIGYRMVTIRIYLEIIV